MSTRDKVVKSFAQTILPLTKIIESAGWAINSPRVYDHFTSVTGAMQSIDAAEMALQDLRRHLIKHRDSFNV